MSDAISAKKLLPTQRVLFTPLSTDVFVVEQHNVVQSPNDSIPAYGTAHDTISKLKSWPNHSFCLQTEPDDQGNYQRVYVANQDTQEQYNWEISDAPDWPTVTQTFVVPRSSYVYPDPTPEATYPPPPNVNTDITGYEITSIEEQRIGEPRLDNLYVAVKVTREKVSLTQIRAYIDLDTNTLQSEVTQKVAAGTVGTVVDASGNYRDITPQNAFWSLSSTKKAQGLAGNSVNGVATRTWYYRDNYTWPRVLNYIHIQPVLADPGDIYSPAVDFSWQPVWLADAFDGPCNYTLVERWTLAKPVFGGDSGWNTGTTWEAVDAWVSGTNYFSTGTPSRVNRSGIYYECTTTNSDVVFNPANWLVLSPLYSSVTPSRINRNGVYYYCTTSNSDTVFTPANWAVSQPDIPEETPMLKQEIYFLGTDLQIRIPACLHEAYQIWDTQFYGFYPATNPTRWPATVLARVTVNPDQGGWLVRMFYVDAPDPSGTATGIQLTQTAATTTGFTLTWAFDADVPAGNITLSISTDPSFDGGFLTVGATVYNELVVMGLSRAITGATRGQVYYATISRGGITSNICVCLGEPEPELNVTNGGVAVASGGSINVGSSEVGTLLNTVIVLNNDGVEQITGLSAGVDGADAAQFSLTTPTSTINAGSSQNLTIGFTPTSTGAKSTTLTIPSNDPDSPYTISLSGTGVQREINVKYSGTSYDSGSNVEVGSVTAGTPSQFTLTIENTGTSALTISSAPITGTDWSVVTAPTSPVAAAGSTTMVVQLSTTTAGASVGTVTINSNDASEPAYVLYLVADVTATPEIEVLAIGNSTPAVWNIPMEDAVTTFDFGYVTGSTRALSFKITNNGYADLTGISVVGDANFVVSGLSGVTAAPGASVTFVVTYTPFGVASAPPGLLNTGTLTITSNDADEGTFTVTLNGHYMSSGTSFSQIEQPTGTILVDGVSSIDFGNVLVSGGTEAKTWTWRNIGQQGLTPGTSVTGTNSADFTVGGVVASLASSNTTIVSDDFTITFDPSGFGVRTASVALSGSGGTATVDVALTGTGIPADALTTGQSADVIVGQLDADDQNNTASQIITPGANGSAVSSGGKLAVADSTSNRILIWNTVPVASGTPADLVLGQANFTDTSANRGGAVASNTLSFPRSVAWDGANLWVADQNNNRVLRYTNPVSNGQAASLVIGQTNFTSGTGRSAATFGTHALNTPTQVRVKGTKLFIVDKDDNRVLIYNTIPTASNPAASVVVGQSTTTGSSSGTTSTTLSGPTGVDVTSTGRLVVADTNNNRVLIYASIPTSNGEAATNVVGQANFTSSTTGTTATTLNTPQSVAASSTGVLAVSDTQNSRVLLWYETPTTDGSSAHAVLGQTTFTSGTGSTSGANVMDTQDGVTWSGSDLLVSGSGMKRTMIFSP